MCGCGQFSVLGHIQNDSYDSLGHLPNKNCDVIFEVLMVAFWDVAPRSLVEVD
jgi:hypothetical protein